MDPVKQFITRTFVEAAQHLTPLLKESKFKETGVLTPEEFIAAGDHMVQQCPTWQWMKGEDGKKKDFLPIDKQYLVTKNVPCYKRVRHVEDHTDDKEKILEEGDGDDGWVDTHHYAKEYGLSEVVGEMSINQKKKESDSSQNNTPLPLTGLSKGGGGDGGGDDDVEGDDDDEEAVDMEAYIKSSNLNDDNTVEATPTDTKATTTTDNSNNNATIDPDILRTRTYDLHITYDTYYRTPRLWLYGYDEDRRPLTRDEVYEDISQDHVKKTVTMETHPHVTLPTMASVHPCRHAEVMKKLIEVVAEGGYDLGVHMYLMVFLKFVQAVIPTIEYDFTQNFNMGRKI